MNFCRSPSTLRFVSLLDYPQHRRSFPRAGKRGPVGESQLGKVRRFHLTPIHNSWSYLLDGETLWSLLYLLGVGVYL